jgi:hypothetical protein
MKTAVLFLVFNRPDPTAKVFDAIRKAKPPRLYIAADGPRKERAGEADRVAKVRKIATAVDWPCEVKILFRDENLGCKYAVSGAISWFFEQEEQGIILEDDCLPSQSFFWYCEELLNRYNKNESIMAVTGTNITRGIFLEYDYFFSRYALMWGWASWARAWKKYDLELRNWPGTGQSKHLKRLGVKRIVEIINWKNRLNRTKNNEINTWDFQWIYTCWFYNGMTVTPAKNLIRNLGFSKDATHTKGIHPILSNLQNNDLIWPLNEPLELAPHKNYDVFISKHWFGATWKSLIKSNLLRIPIISLFNKIRKQYFEKIN